MILINLKGGLGNQLFQYACGRALSVRNNDEVTIDITQYKRQNRIDTIRQYALSPFKISTRIATPLEIKHIKYPYGLISKSIRFVRTKVLRQFNVNYTPRILKQRGNIYLDGFFQTEKYFADIRPTLISEISLKAPWGQSAHVVANQIRNAPNSVSLHVRRGDYVQDTKTNQHHGTCGAHYYAHALEVLAEKIGANIHLFIFSDDIEWVRANLTLPYPTTYVSDTSIPDYEELMLMSLCSHNIIANSSFSWWGAWLNQNSGKIVIAPREWVRTGKHNFRDIVPDSWIRI